MANTPCTYRGGEAGGGQHHELRDGHDDEALVVRSTITMKQARQARVGGEKKEDVRKGEGLSENRRKGVGSGWLYPPLDPAFALPLTPCPPPSLPLSASHLGKIVVHGQQRGEEGTEEPIARSHATHWVCRKGLGGGRGGGYEYDEVGGSVRGR